MSSPTSNGKRNITKKDITNRYLTRLKYDTEAVTNYPMTTNKPS